MSDTGIGEGAEYHAFTGPKHELVDRPVMNLQGPQGNGRGGDSVGGMIHNSIMTRRQHMENAAHRAWMSEEGDKQHQRHLELLGVHHSQTMEQKAADAAHQHSFIDRAAPGTMVSVEGGGHRATLTTPKAPRAPRATRATRPAAKAPTTKGTGK